MRRAESDIRGFEGWNGWHVLTPYNMALEICFGCGMALCETDYVEDQEFLPDDIGLAPDPHYVTVCEGCSYAYGMDIEPDEFYMDGR